MIRARLTLVAALAAALACSASVVAEDQKDQKAPASDAAAAKYFTNTELVDQDGIPRRLYQDLLRGRKVLVNFAFTSCKGVCPTMTQNLAQVQKLLGKRVGKEITMLTITVDPVNDTPQVLKAFAAKFQVGPGWHFLTGAPENVNSVLKRLGGAVKNPGEHASTLIIGDTTTGTWVKTIATERPETIVYVIDHLNDSKGGQ
jgi:protein SCO1/2